MHWHFAEKGFLTADFADSADRKNYLRNPRNPRLSLPLVAASPGWELSGLALLIVTLAVGCSKHAPVATAEPSTNVAQVDVTTDALPQPPTPRGGMPSGEAATAAVISDSGDMNATLGQLTSELRKYVVRTRSVPKTFEEFAAKSHLQIPPAPPGKKYAIENKAVVLVNL